MSSDREVNCFFKGRGRCRRLRGGRKPQPYRAGMSLLVVATPGGVGPNYQRKAIVHDKYTPHLALLVFSTGSFARDAAVDAFAARRTDRVAAPRSKCTRSHQR